jgi:iron(III) transport system ATP-binding protein
VEIGAAGSAGLPGTVRKAAYIGGVMEYTIATELGELFVVSIAVDRPLVAGAPVAVTLASHGVVPIATA